MKRFVHPFLAVFVAASTNLSGQTTPTLTVTAQPTNEGLIGLAVNFQLSQPAAGGERVIFELTDGSAIGGVDFIPFNPFGIIDFEAGDINQTQVLTIIDDSLVEPDETFNLVVTETIGLTPSSLTTQLTILNDDSPTQNADGDLVLPAFFSNGMVLQRDKGAPFWGLTNPGEQVTVQFAGRTWTDNADSQGEFRVVLDNLAASAVSRDLVVSAGESSIVISDVLVGEVWMGAGQSNMEFPFAFLPTPENNAEVANANDPLLRLYLPQEQARENPVNTLPGSWLRAVPGDMPDMPAFPYFFAQRLRDELGVPVAIMECAWGGQRIEGFISEEALLSFPEGADVIAQKEAEYDAFEATGQGSDPAFEPNLGAQIYNGMVAPLAGYGLRGIVFYQGEANSFFFASPNYATFLETLVADWRDAWDEDLPFYNMQLTNFEGVDDGRTQWVNVQNQQRIAFGNLDQSGIVITNDIGDPDDIHPSDKRVFAARAARWPLANEYGKTGDILTGPIFRDAFTSGSTIVVNFDYAAGLSTRNGGSLGSFELREAGGSWTSASAVILGESVTVSAPGLSAPAEVRYAWDDNPTNSNLVNADGLPASVFAAVAEEGEPTPGTIVVATAEPTNEGIIGLVVNFELSQPAVGGERIVFELVDGTALANEDYIPFNPVGIIDFSAGETSQTQVLTMLDDSIVEPDETFTLELSSPTGLIVAQPSLLLTILNDDLAPGEDPTLTAGASPANEGDGEILVTLELSAPALGGESFDYSLSSGTATEGEDFPSTSGQVSFQAGQTSQILSVPVFDDGDAEIDETFSLDFTSPSGLQLGLASLELTIVNDDVAPTPEISVSASAPATNEGIIGMVITLQLSAPAEGGEGFNFSLNSGTATAGEDFIDWIGGQVVFEAGETSQNLILTMIDDDVVEPNETFSIEFFNPSGVILTQSVLEMTILNDDSGTGPVDPPTLAVSASAPATNEGIIGMVVTFDLSEPAEGGENFNFELNSGTAIVGEDFNDWNGGQVVFEAGETSQNLILTMIDDDVEEPNETFTIDFFNPDGVLLNQSSLELMIVNDDGDTTNPSNLVVTASASPTNEGIIGMLVDFELSSPASGGEKFNFEMLPGTATPGEDYLVWNGGVVEFQAGETSQTLILTMVDDAIFEADETFTLAFSNPSELALLQDSLELVIVNDDAPPVGGNVVTISSQPTNEGLIGYLVTFNLAAPAVGGESFDYFLSPGTANPYEDYVPFDVGTVVFEAGETSQSILLTMNDDSVAEPDETFVISLSNPSGLNLEEDSSSQELVILNDDSVLDDYGDRFGLSVEERSIDADDDGDGISFFLEYAFNLDPTVGADPSYVSGQAWPNGEPFGLPNIIVEKDPVTNEEIVKYVYIRRNNSYPKIEYFTEVSENGIDFFIVEPDKVTPIGDFFEEVEVIFGHANGDTSRCFARVRVVAEDDNGDGF